MVYDFLRLERKITRVRDKIEDTLYSCG
jgi:hypothetical protein